MILRHSNNVSIFVDMLKLTGYLDFTITVHQMKWIFNCNKNSAIRVNRTRFETSNKHTMHTSILRATGNDTIYTKHTQH